MTRFRFLVPALMVAAIAAIGGSSVSASAYGTADQPIAQVEVSANCNNPTFPLCQQVGLGGVWFWSELDTAGGNTMDYTLTFCGHATPALPLPPGAAPGAFGHPGTGTWSWIANLSQAPPGAFPFFSGYNGSQGYYVLDFFPGSGQNDFIAVVPAAIGHYSFKPVSGTTIQTQIAP